MSSQIIRCIHDGKKTRLIVEYYGNEKTISACDDCYDIIKSSNLCKILEII